MAVATGIKRGRPDLIVFHLPGRRRLASIGMAETVHAGEPRREDHGHLRQQRHLRDDGRPDGADDAARADRHDVPTGRDVSLAGYPIRVVELLATLRTPAYLARVSVHEPRRS